MQLSKYYTQAVIYPSLVMLAIMLPYTIIVNQDYKSEWMSAEDVIFMTMLWAVGSCIFFGLLCLPVFLCNDKSVSSSKFLTFLCWFLLPGLLFIYELYFLLDAPDDVSSNEALGALFIINIPFIIGLIRAFRNYKKQLVGIHSSH